MRYCNRLQCSRFYKLIKGRDNEGRLVREKDDFYGTQCFLYGFCLPPCGSVKDALSRTARYYLAPAAITFRGSCDLRRNASNQETHRQQNEKHVTLISVFYYSPTPIARTFALRTGAILVKQKK